VLTLTIKLIYKDQIKKSMKKYLILLYLLFFFPIIAQERDKSTNYYRFPALIPHINQVDFFLSKSSHIFDINEAADEVMFWGANYTPYATRINTNTSALGLFIEANYNDGGANWKELQFRFTTKDDIQHRPWAWRLNENNLKDWILGTETYRFVLVDPSTQNQYLNINPLGISFQSELAKQINKSFQIIDDGANIILVRHGSGNFMFQNFDTVYFPNAHIGLKYAQFRQPFYTSDLYVSGDFRAPNSPQIKNLQAQIDDLKARIAVLEKKLLP
jgi:hypothetical protein